MRNNKAGSSSRPCFTTLNYAGLVLLVLAVAFVFLARLRVGIAVLLLAALTGLLMLLVLLLVGLVLLLVALRLLARLLVLLARLAVLLFRLGRVLRGWLLIHDDNSLNGMPQKSRGPASQCRLSTLDQIHCMEVGIGEIDAKSHASRRTG